MAAGPNEKGFSSDADFLAGGGEIGERIRTFEWASTPLGPISGWSPALKMMTRLLLANRFPLLLWWGPEYVSLYNDPYRPILGNKHPWALGQPVSECWKEIWPVLQPLIDTPFHGGPATWNDDLFLEINRHGFVEETHFTVAYSPVPDETAANGIGGVLATVHEITGKVVSDRRLLVLRDLGARSGEAGNPEEACELAAQTLDCHSKDIPFALLYLIDGGRKQARLSGTAGVPGGHPASPPVIPLDGSQGGMPWPLAEAMRSENIVVITDLPTRLGDNVPPGPWKDRPHTAAVVPIRSNKAHYLAG
ncbi:MAG TPA: response regulator receiver protein, partial [Thermodesulfobacteriota bacterium]|nr:response regulator receiver protein [Thermodesulfobacteriota bacterium]